MRPRLERNTPRIDATKYYRIDCKVIVLERQQRRIVAELYRLMTQQIAMQHIALQRLGEHL